ncbi:putative aminopeptidase NPEPL1 [Pimephales promelas]|nr:putative aminopeptidase NPEPL1 [Pimephales promelas]
MANVVLEFKASAGDSEPQNRPVLIVGQLANLQQINWTQDRENAQSSCAGLFIGSHLGFDWPGIWVHVDIASPVHAGERATGFGVAMLLSLFGQASEDPLLNSVSPLGAGTVEPGSEDQMGRDCKRRRLI